MDNLGNYALLPPAVIEHFIRSGAAAFGKPGWLVVDHRQPGPWLDYFTVAYQVTAKVVFGGYTAYRLAPR